MGLRLYGLPDARQATAMPSPQDTKQPSSSQQTQHQQYAPRMMPMPIPSYSPSSRPAPISAPPVQAVSVPAPPSPLASTLVPAALHPHHEPQVVPPMAPAAPRQYHYHYQYQWQQQQHQQGLPPTGAGVNTGAGTTRPKTEAELEADRLYEEAMEDEYAKRDGGC